jgi:polyisoprenoid-binding protein YceI
MFRPTAAIAAAILFSACADVGDAPTADITPGDAVADVTEEVVLPTGEAVAIDTAASTIEWTAAKVTRTHQGGFSAFSGVIYLDGGAVTGADVTADAASIYSDEDRLTGHLKSDDFFDVTVHPQVRFLVSSLTPTRDSAATRGATHIAEGEITMHGRSNRLSFPIAISMDAGSIVADADFIIDRQLWGLSYPGQPDDLISDEVRVRLHIVAPAPAGSRAPSGPAPAASP